jgi:peptidoglycan/LPS O-acetylase OafA/YrhL
MSKKSEYRNDIQIIRGIAVLAVVLFHSNEKFFPNGFLGVDIFFVVSGFVVTPLLARIVEKNENLNKKITRLKLFYKLRFFRLAPALIVTLIFSVFLIFLLGSPDYHSRFANQGIFTLSLLGNIGAYGFSGDYFSPNPNPLVHFWSLSVEEQIYLFFPLILLILFIKFKYSIKKLAFIFLIITCISMTSFLSPEILEPFYTEIGIRSPTQFSFYSPIDRLWQFTLGGIGYFILQSDFLRNKGNNIIINWGLVMLTLLSLLSVINFDLKNDSIFISFFVLLTLIFRSFDFLPKTLKNIFKWLGDRSYSIYLIHLPMLWIAKYSIATQIGTTNNRFIQIFLALILILCLGAISFVKIENRYRLKPSNISQKNNTDTIKLIACLLLPLTLLVMMKVAVANKYWGLDKNIAQPVFPGNLDTYCIKETERSSPCIYARDGNKNTVLLVGDSHASHFSEAFKTSASNTGWNLVIWTKNGCQVKFSSNVRDSSLANCVNSFLALEKWVLSNKPSVVVVSQYIRDDSNLNQLQSALLRLKLSVPNVLLIGNNPVFPGDDRFLEARPLIMPPAKPKKYFLNSEMKISDEDKSNELLSWARSNQLDTLDIKPLFCDSIGCSRYSNGNWLYRDPSHLSVSGADLIIPKISEYFSKKDS